MRDRDGPTLLDGDAPLRMRVVSGGGECVGGLEDMLAALHGVRPPARVRSVPRAQPDGDDGDDGDDGMEDALALLGEDGRVRTPGLVRSLNGAGAGADAGAEGTGDGADGVEDALALLDEELLDDKGKGGARRGAGPLSEVRGAQDGSPPGGDREDGVEDALLLLSADARTPAGSAAGSGPGGPGGSPAAPGRPGGPTGPAEGRAGAAGAVPHGGPDAVPWAEAREIAVHAGRGGRPSSERVPLARALGRVLGEPLTALCDLPSFDTSAMDGWAVAGPGPWTVRSGAVLAGRGAVSPLEDGTAVRIATGARIPPEATAVLRSEHARLDGRQRLLHADRGLPHGQDIRPRGQECRSGDRLLPAARRVTPAVLGLAAAAGYDALEVVARPRVEVLILGDELLADGLPHEGLIRDALGPMLLPWLEGLGAETVAVRRIGDDADVLHRAVTASPAELLITTGGTAAGPVDHVHAVLRRTDAETLVDSVAVRPGHPMLLARLGGGTGAMTGGAPVRHLVGLPGNPLAAVAGLLTLADPLVRGVLGMAPRAPHRAPVDEEVPGHPRDTRLVPCVQQDGRLLPLRYHGPAMLRGIAAAEGLAVVEPGGARPGDELEVLRLPWAPS
ncbi:molybdopterin molybdotransferase MoeA [Streptomyces clavuligerus]|uniref:molybdopterin molybdotransferase MoeA n=1 Tax=Streptomyces clavuligerus TaxID=1901 RepID=UPI0018D0883B